MCIRFLVKIQTTTDGLKIENNLFLNEIPTPTYDIGRKREGAQYPMVWDARAGNLRTVKTGNMCYGYGREWAVGM